MSQPATPAEAGATRRERPLINDDNAYFWDGVAAGKLLIQQCTACRVLRHPSSPSCPRCQSLNWDTVEASGRGVIYSFVVVHRPPAQGLPVPNVVVLVELEEGVRMPVSTQHIPRDRLWIGAPVTVGFVDDDGFIFPDCSLAGSGTKVGDVS
jgi:uncharacterized protein